MGSFEYMELSGRPVVVTCLRANTSQAMASGSSSHQANQGLPAVWREEALCRPHKEEALMLQEFGLQL